ncbi:hypothetical protein C0U44_30400, partial [Klebsiella pneumoniae]
MMSGLPLLIVSPLAALLLGMSLHDAGVLVMDRLFRDDWQDGSLEQLMLLPTPLVAVVLV